MVGETGSLQTGPTTYFSDRHRRSMKMLSMHRPRPVYGDCNAGIPEHIGELKAGELAALIGVEYLRRAIPGQGFVKSLDTEPGIHGVREPQGQHMTLLDKHRLIA